MDARASEPNRTTVERTSERELVVTRTFNGPARLVCGLPVSFAQLDELLATLGR